MGLQAFLLKLAIALMDRLDTGDSRSEDEYEAAKSVISEVSKRLIQLQPKLDKLINLRTTK